MKWIICSIALLGAVTIQAQKITASPYSSFGLGDQLYNNNPEQGGMGGITTVPTNPYGQSANFSNPAANTGLRMTNFNVSVRGDNNQFKSSNGKVSTGSFKLSNISLAFPTSPKSSFGFGYQPYTALGYDITSTQQTNGLKQQMSFTGDGGLNSLHAFYNRNLSENLSVGLRANYLFGELKANEKISVEGASLLTDYSNKANYSGLQVTLGAMYQKKIDKTKNLNIGAYYTIGSSIGTDLTELTRTYTYVGNNESSVDTVFSKRDSRLKTKMPHTFALGASYGKDNKWSLAGEFRYNTWSNFEKPTLGQSSSINSNTKYKNNLYVGLGGYWIPNFISYKSYFSRVIYRGGLYYESASYSVFGQDIDRYGITLGAGLPIGKINDGSMINISLEYGQKGSTNKGLLKDNYFGFKLGFDLNDIWFRKRVID